MDFDNLKFLRKLEKGKQYFGKQLEQAIMDASNMYRKVHILVSGSNRGQYWILVSTLVSLMTVFVLSSVSIIKALTTGKLLEPSLIFMHCFLLQTVVYTGFVLVTVFGVCGCLHHEAGKIVLHMKRIPLFFGWKQKILRRTVKTLSVLKIQFGSFNFLEKRTPFVYVGFAVGKIVDSLLLSKR